MMLCTEIARHEQEKHYSLWQNLNFIFGISEIKPASSSLYWCCSSCSAASYTVYIQFGNNTFKCHRKWLTAKMFSLPETPKVGGDHFGFTSVMLESVGIKLSWCGGWEFYENLIMSHTLVARMNSDWEHKHRWILRKAVLNIWCISFILYGSFC